MARRARILLPLVVLAAAALLAPSAQAQVAGDFDDDGFADLAAGVPGEDVGSTVDAGAVNVIFGAQGGLTADGNALLTPGSWGGAEPANARFGTALATGDFDGDGFADLAIGAPGQASGAGRVYVVYGSSGGLTRFGAVLAQGDVKGQAEPGDAFGSALAAGDFDGDGRDDLAIGAPGEDVRRARDAGTVDVIYGTAQGLGDRGDAFHQDRPAIDDRVESGDRFGAALAAGDFGRSSGDDLAVGIPGEDVLGKANAGAVAVLMSAGRPGLTPRDDQFIHQDSPGVVDEADAGDAFGSALAAGDLGVSLLDDLAVGAPGEDVGGTNGAGAVVVLFGDSSLGLRGQGSQLLTQDTADVEDAAEASDGFGAALATGALNGDAQADLAIGVPGEDVGPEPDAGAVAVLYGAATGPSTTGDQLWHQQLPNLEDQAEAGDRFGAALAIAAFGGAVPGLAVGVPGEDRRAKDEGAVAVLYGGPAGLGSPINQLWGQFTPGIDNPSESGDGFGSALARR